MDLQKRETCGLLIVNLILCQTVRIEKLKMYCKTLANSLRFLTNIDILSLN